MKVGHSLAVLNFAANAFVAKSEFFPGAGTWLVKSCSNKLYEPVYPVKLYIAKIFAEGTPSLKNFAANPGTIFYFEKSGYFANEILKSAFSHPLKIPVYGWFLYETNSISATNPTVWINFGLSSIFNNP